jgi:hypothetical protein
MKILELNNSRLVHFVSESSLIGHRSAKWYFSLLIIVVLAIASVPKLFASDEVGCIVEGSFIGDHIHETLAPVAKYVNGTFRIAIQGSNWVIGCDYTSATSNSKSLYLRVDASCDGQNIYVVHALNPSVVAQNVEKNEAAVYPGIYPPPQERETYYLWLAFVSSTIFADTHGMAKPPNTPDLSMFYNTNIWCRYEWATNSGCARELVLKTEGNILVRDKSHNGALISYSLKPPYQDGYMLANARWINMTNVLGIFVPMQYEYSSFAPKPAAASSTDLQKIYSYNCKVTNVFTAPIPAVPAALQGDREVFVFDHRFFSNDVATLTYSWTNSWHELTKAKLEKRLEGVPKETLEEQSLKQHGFIPKTNSLLNENKRMIVRIVLVITLIMPFAVLKLKTAIQKTNKTNKEQKGC